MSGDEAKKLVDSMTARFLIMRASWDMVGAMSIDCVEGFGEGLESLESAALDFALTVAGVKELWKNVPKG
jgi:hypothetical protein